MMPHGGWPGMGWYMIFGLLFWIFVPILAAIGMVRATRRRGEAKDDGEAKSAASTALNTLEMRYARGEIGRTTASANISCGMAPPFH